LSNRKTEQLTRSSSRGCGKAGNSPIVFRFSTNPTLTIQTVAEAKPKDPRSLFGNHARHFELSTPCLVIPSEESSGSRDRTHVMCEQPGTPTRIL
jgi:hypothetical protein